MPVGTDNPAASVIAEFEARCRFGRPRSDHELLDLEIAVCADCGRAQATIDPNNDLCADCADALLLARNGGDGE